MSFPPFYVQKDLLQYDEDFERGDIEPRIHFLSNPETLKSCVTSILSSSLNNGSIPEYAFANSVLPDPGGPIKMTLCPPAAAISEARFACLPMNIRPI